MLAADQVLIIGAGPTGLSLAITLRQQGVRVRIVDRAAQPSTVSKALAIWSGSLEAMATMGVAERFVSEGKRLRSLQAGDGRYRLATIRVGAGIDSPYPFPLLLPQSRTEQILTERLAELGVTVERGTELEDLAQSANAVTAELRRPGGELETAEVSFLVGCDGARSQVRQKLEIAFEGYTEPETFLLGDISIAGGNLDPASIYVWWSAAGTVALFPFGDNLWRLFAKRPMTQDPQTPCTLDELQQHLGRSGPPGLTAHSPVWLSTFKINERLAARYRDGRCFLAGDAAHIHSPAGGQGMNTGIQDAVNLGWKLAAALHGTGDAETLLASYEPERRPVARAVIAESARRQHVAFADGTPGRLARDLGLLALGNLPAMHRKLMVQLSETDIAYREGPLVPPGEAARRPRRPEAGTRALDGRYIDAASGLEQPLWPLLSQPAHTLLVFADTASAALGTDPARLRTRCGSGLTILQLDSRADPQSHLRRRYRVTGDGWVLIRPDQVIAARGSRTDRGLLDAYIETAIRPRSAETQPAAAEGEGAEIGLAVPAPAGLRA